MMNNRLYKLFKINKIFGMNNLLSIFINKKNINKII